MAQYVSWLSILVLAIAFIAMATALQNAVNQGIATNLAKTAIAIIVFMFSGGYIRLAFSYSKLAQQAAQIENYANRMTKEPEISEVQAIKLLHDYQITRSAAPMLPTWLWRSMENELNHLWQQEKI